MRESRSAIVGECAELRIQSPGDAADLILVDAVGEAAAGVPLAYQIKASGNERAGQVRAVHSSAVARDQGAAGRDGPSTGVEETAAIAAPIAAKGIPNPASSNNHRVVAERAVCQV